MSDEAKVDWAHHEQVAERLVRQRAADFPRDPRQPLVIGGPPRPAMYLSGVNAKALVRLLDAARARADAQECEVTARGQQIASLMRQADEWKARAEKAEGLLKFTTKARENDMLSAVANEERLTKRAEAAEAALVKADEEEGRLRQLLAAEESRCMGMETELAKVTKERDEARELVRLRVLLPQAQVGDYENTLKAAAETVAVLRGGIEGHFDSCGCPACMFLRRLPDAGKAYASPAEQRALAERAWDLGMSHGESIACQGDCDQARKHDLDALLGGG